MRGLANLRKVSRATAGSTCSGGQRDYTPVAISGRGVYRRKSAPLEDCSGGNKHVLTEDDL